MTDNIYDVIVVGEHKEYENAVTFTNSGSRTLFITKDMTKFAQIFYYYAIAGILKGLIVLKNKAFWRRKILKSIPNLFLLQYTVLNLLIKNNIIVGVRTTLSGRYVCDL